MTLHMKMILLSLVLLTVGFEVAYGGKLLKNLNKTKGQGGLERINGDKTKWIMRKVRKMSKAFDVLEEQLVSASANIASLVTDTATNNASIASNDVELATLTGNVASNTVDVAINHADIVSNDADIASLVQDTSNYTAYLASQSSAIGTLQIDVNNNEAGIATNLANIASNVVDIDSHDSRINDVQNDMGDVQNDMGDVQNDMGDVQNDIVSLKTNGSGSVWFDAWRTNSIGASNSWTTITYTNVRESSSNSGAMDIGTGVFTASMAGTYQFIISVMKDNDVDAYVKIKMDGSGGFDGNTISGIYQGDGDTPNRATITGTAVITVNPGQKVWVETNERVYSNLDGLIRFTGVLITPE